MKKIGLIFSCVMLMVLSSCGTSYERSSEPGEIVQITYEEYKKMEKTDDTYMVLVTQTYCSFCKEYKKNVLDKYLADHGLTIYELNITNEKDPNAVYDNFIKTYGDDFAGTPTTLIFEKGENKVVKAGVIEEDDLDDYVTSYQLDKK